jgi:DeoR/GlpR family transcriptional regulator of sugar metabolism
MDKTATVVEIAEWAGTSPATVGRELAWLEEQGLITYTRGGATTGALFLAQA